MAYIGQTPSAVPLDGDDIADDIITLAKLATGTDGNIISYDASGNPVAIATGSNGQVLTSTGAGSPPAFEAIPAGGVDGITSSANATAITISADEQVQMPLQPCFNVKLNANATNVTGAGAGYNIAFDTEVFDIGSNYASSVFTAPVTGKYLLTMHVVFGMNTSYTADYWSSNIVTSNRTYTNWALDTNFTWRDWATSLAVITDMDASDTAVVNVGVAGVSSNSIRIESAGYSSFTGVLLT